MQAIKNISDQDLLNQLRSGQNMNEAVKTIYRDYFETLSRFVQQNNGSDQDAEDIFQEVIVNFIDLVKHDKFRGDSSIKTFLFSMNRFAWLNELKKRNRSENRELKYEINSEKEVLSSAQFIEDRESAKQVMELVNQLGEVCKKILLMFYYENLSMKEILENVDYENEQVVRNKKYKCLKQLESMITENPIFYQTMKNILHG